MSQRTILFTTDFQTPNRDAFRWACRLASAWNAKLLVVHIQNNRDEIVGQDRDPAQEFEHYVPEDLSIDFEHLVRQGDPGREILGIIEKLNIVMVVLSTHGRTGIERVFTGSVAEQIIRKADCAVMTLRDSAESFVEGKEITRILVPVDFSVYGYAALDFATSLAIGIGAELSIIHVDDHDHSATKEHPHGAPEMDERQHGLWDQLKQFKPSVDSVKYIHKIFKGDPAKEISDYANEKHYDFVVVGTHGRTGLGRVLMGSVAEQVVRNTKCPIVSVKPNNRRTVVLSA